VLSDRHERSPAVRCQPMLFFELRQYHGASTAALVVAALMCTSASRTARKRPRKSGRQRAREQSTLARMRIRYVADNPTRRHPRRRIRQIGNAASKTARPHVCV
jgi:hypothetical protein